MFTLLRARKDGGSSLKGSFSVTDETCCDTSEREKENVVVKRGEIRSLIVFSKKKKKKPSSMWIPPFPPPLLSDSHVQLHSSSVCLKDRFSRGRPRGQRLSTPPIGLLSFTNI